MSKQKMTDSEILSHIEAFIAAGLEEEKKTRPHGHNFDTGWYEYGKNLARQIQIMRGEATSDNAPGRD